MFLPLPDEDAVLLKHKGMGEIMESKSNVIIHCRYRHINSLLQHLHERDADNALSPMIANPHIRTTSAVETCRQMWIVMIYIP